VAPISPHARARGPAGCEEGSSGSPSRAEQDVTPLVIPLPKPAEDYMPEREDLFRAVLTSTGRSTMILCQFWEAAVGRVSEALVFGCGNTALCLPL